MVCLPRFVHSTGTGAKTNNFKLTWHVSCNETDANYLDTTIEHPQVTSKSYSSFH